MTNNSRVTVDTTYIITIWVKGLEILADLVSESNGSDVNKNNVVEKNAIVILIIVPMTLLLLVMAVKGVMTAPGRLAHYMPYNSPGQNSKTCYCCKKGQQVRNHQDARCFTCNMQGQTSKDCSERRRSNPQRQGYLSGTSRSPDRC